MSEHSSPSVAADVILAGRYRLHARIASGGMAEVWAARDEVLARQVAVKVLHPHLADDDTVRQRFRREAIAAARLQHPNIVALFDTCSDGRTEAIVMEHVAGTTLRARLDEHGPLEPGPAVLLAADVAAALEHAHRHGIVHRDVKPSNILLSDDGRVLLTDLGIAKAVAAGELTRPDGAFLGSARYAAPEQLTGEEVDGRTDLYALGVVLYEAVCGRPPFAGDTDAATALQRLHRPPLSPRQVRPGIPKALDQLIVRCLAVDPGARPSSAGELRSALLGLELPGLGAAAAPPTAPAGPPTGAPAQASAGTAPATTAEPRTPPAGTTPSFRETERSYLVPALVIVLIAAGLGGAALVLGSTGVGQDLFRATREAVTGKAPQPVAGLVARAFDPEGDGHEHDDDAALAVDGDGATAWTSEGYRVRRFGTKSGVGLVVELPAGRPLRELRVRATTRGWAAQVHVADGPAGAELAAWGPPVATATAIAGDATFGLGGRHGRAVLVWITDLGEGPPPHRIELNEVELLA